MLPPCRIESRQAVADKPYPCDAVALLWQACTSEPPVITNGDRRQQIADAVRAGRYIQPGETYTELDVIGQSGEADGKLLYRLRCSAPFIELLDNCNLARRCGSLKPKAQLRLSVNEVEEPIPCDAKVLMEQYLGLIPTAGSVANAMSAVIRPERSFIEATWVRADGTRGIFRANPKGFWQCADLAMFPFTHLGVLNTRPAMSQPVLTQSNKENTMKAKTANVNCDKHYRVVGVFFGAVFDHRGNRLRAVELDLIEQHDGTLCYFPHLAMSNVNTDNYDEEGYLEFNVSLYPLFGREVPPLRVTSESVNFLGRDATEMLVPQLQATGMAGRSAPAKLISQDVAGNRVVGAIFLLVEPIKADNDETEVLEYSGLQLSSDSVTRHLLAAEYDRATAHEFCRLSYQHKIMRSLRHHAGSTYDDALNAQSSCLYQPHGYDSTQPFKSA